MLTQLLDLLDEGRVFSQWELAERLGINAGAVKAQMEYLEQLGFLRRVCDTAACESCSGSCGSCGGCAQGAPKGPAMWEKVSP